MTRVLALGTLATLIGCAPAPVDMPFDSDEDGIMDPDELEMGLDPNNPDSDGDSFADLEEINVGTDPLNPDDHPYLGGWPMDACADSIESTGAQVGDVAADFEVMDQFGDMLHLHDLCDHTVLLVSAAFW